MSEAQAIRFEDGAAYERYMGRWSQRVGTEFLDWLGLPQALEWLDVGCGNGAFTELLIRRCAPARVCGIDPAAAQLAYARRRDGVQAAQFLEGDAMALPFPADSFDVAVMPLVIFFVPEPARGVAEMARVVRPGGTVAAYTWDMEAGGFPYQLLRTQMQELGLAPPAPPSVDASRVEALAELWAGAGLTAVQLRPITVHRTFTDFEDYWHTVLGAPSMGRKLAALAPGQRAQLWARLKERLATDPAGAIRCTARTNAVRGRVAVG
ncbi:MAG TPA: class I SAM-dependent methyltransferase [Steroidobacteraceae bacterium]|nr:class I SAM-dependent methyltransferase [Steroidobacteraceae bacterium]